MDNREAFESEIFQEQSEAEQSRKQQRGWGTSKVFFNKASVFLFCSAVFLLPVMFLPASGLTVSSSKVLVIALLVFLSGLSFFYSRQSSEPRIPTLLLSLLGALGFLVLVSTALSESFTTSFVYGLQPSTFYVLMLALIASGLGALIISTPQRSIAFFAAFLGGGALLGLFHLLRLVFGPGALSFGIFTDPTSSPVGSWFDLGVFVGILYLSSLVVIVFGSLPGRIRQILVGVLIVSILFLAIIHFRPLLILLAVLTVGVFVIALKERVRQGREVVIASFVALVSLVLLSTPLTALTVGVFDTGYAEVYPSWQSTKEVVGKNILNPKTLLVGNGPNTFPLIWQNDRGTNVIESPYWSTEFSFATSLFATNILTHGVLFSLGFLALLGYAGYIVVASKQTGQNNFYMLVARTSGVVAFSIFLVSLFHVIGSGQLLLAFIFLGVAASAHSTGSKRERTSIPLRGEGGTYIYGIALGVFVIGVLHMLLTTTSRLMYGQAIEGLAKVSQLSEFKAIDSKFARAGLFERSDTVARARAELALLEMRTILSLGEQEVTADTQAQFEAAFVRVQETSEMATIIDPRNYRNWMVKGFVFESLGGLEVEGAYDVAMSAYNQASLEYPTNPEIVLIRARVEKARGNSTEARTLAREAIEMKKGFVNGYLFLAELELEQGGDGRALVVLEEAMRANPTSATVHYEVGSIYYKRGDFESAEVSYSRAIGIDQRYANALYFRGLSRLALGEKEAALRDLRIVFETNKTNGDLERVINNIEADREPFLGINTGEGSLLPQRPGLQTQGGGGSTEVLTGDSVESSESSVPMQEGQSAPVIPDGLELEEESQSEINE